MFLNILRPIVRLALWIFFREIDVRGRDRIPSDRPLIFVANHPNVMLDTLILGCFVPGKTPRFLGKSTLFKNSFYARLLRLLGVIPVARAREGRTASNRDMLRLACQTLQDGHSLAIFPEGVSHAQPRVLALKSGAARIALKAGAEAGGQLCIVPVGLTYSDPGLFRSDVSVHFGQAIEVAPFLQSYCRNRNGTERELTRKIHERLTALSRHIDSPNLETVIRDLSAIYAETVAAAIPDTAELNRRLCAQQEIIRAVHHFADTDPDLVRTFGTRLRTHHRKLERLHLQPGILPSSSPPLSHLLLALLLSPVVLYGFIHNALPYYLPSLFVRPHRAEPEMLGTVKIAVGTVLFPLYYLVLIGTVYLLTGLQTALIYGTTLPLSGFITLFFEERILQKWPLWQGLALPRTRRHHLTQLTEERAAIVSDLDALKTRYLADN